METSKAKSISLCFPTPCSLQMLCPLVEDHGSQSGHSEPLLLSPALRNKFPHLLSLSYSIQQREEQEPMTNSIPGTDQKAAFARPIPARFYSPNHSAPQTHKQLSVSASALCPFLQVSEFRSLECFQHVSPQGFWTDMPLSQHATLMT